MKIFNQTKKNNVPDEVFHLGENTSHQSALSHSLRKVASRHSSSKQEGPDEAPGIYRSRTTGDSYEDDFEIKRTGSGGLFMMKKKGFHEKMEISRAKAIQMSAVLELSDVRDTDLNKNVKLKRKPREITAAPSLRTMTAAQAVEAYKKQEKIAEQNKKPDPLLSERELEAEKRTEEHKKWKEDKLKKRDVLRQKHSSADRPRMPLSHRQENIVVAVSATHKPKRNGGSHSDLPVEESIEVVLPSVSNKSRQQTTLLHDLPAIC